MHTVENVVYALPSETDAKLVWSAKLIFLGII